MNSALKIGLIVGGGWLLFHDQLSALFGGSATAAASSPAPAPSATPEVPAIGPGVDANSTATTYQLLLNWAQQQTAYRTNNGLMNGWQWQYGYQAVRGGSVPDISTIVSDPSRLMTLGEYWTAATAHGLSGVKPSRAIRAWRRV